MTCCHFPQRINCSQSIKHNIVLPTRIVGTVHVEISWRINFHGGCSSTKFKHKNIARASNLYIKIPCVCVFMKIWHKKFLTHKIFTTNISTYTVINYVSTLSTSCCLVIMYITYRSLAEQFDLSCNITYYDRHTFSWTKKRIPNESLKIYIVYLLNSRTLSSSYSSSRPCYIRRGNLLKALIHTSMTHHSDRYWIAFAFLEHNTEISSCIYQGTFVCNKEKV